MKQHNSCRQSSPCQKFPGPQVIRLPLSGKYGEGKYLLIDADVYEALEGRALRVMKDGYIRIKVEGKEILLHRWILRLPKGVMGDHKHHDKLDNRREMLRPANRFQNMWNRQNKQRGRSKYKGVCWIERRRQWKTSIRLNGSTAFLGYFESEFEAARAYDGAALHHFGEFACVNFSDSLPKPSDDIRAESRLAPLKSSQFKGVSLCKQTGRFAAELCIGSKRLKLGRFVSQDEAARAYDDARVAHGLSRFNFPKED